MAEQSESERGIGSFFIPINGEFFDAIQAGQLRTANGITTYFILQRQAVFETGIWWGDAARIVHGSGGILSSDQAQRALREICENGHAKSFHMRGSRREYAVALHGFAVRYGKFKGMVLDAFATTDPRNPVYVKPSEPLSRPIPCGIAGPVEEWVPSECDGEDKPVSRTNAAEDGIRRTSATEETEIASSLARQSQLSRSSVAPVRRNTPDVPEAPYGPEKELKQSMSANNADSPCVAQQPIKSPTGCLLTDYSTIVEAIEEYQPDETHDFITVEDAPAILSAISDGRFKPELHPGYEYLELLYACNDVLLHHANDPYWGPKTNGDLMAEVMENLRRDYGLDVPSSWYPIIKELRAEGTDPQYTDPLPKAA